MPTSTNPTTRPATGSAGRTGDAATKPEPDAATTSANNDSSTTKCGWSIKAVELYVETKQAAPDFQARAAAALEEIEREAAARRGAIQALLGQGDGTEKPAAARKK